MDLVTADGRKERSYARACREFASTQFVNRLNAGFAICHYGRWVLRLDNKRGEMLDGSGNGQCFDFAGKPSDLVFSQFGTEEAG